MAEKKEVKEKEVKQESEAKKARRAYFEAYKKRNPVKYEIKKAAFEAELASIE